MAALLAGATVTSPVHQADRLDGLWRTTGYGTIVSIAGGRLTSYAITSVSCGPGDLAGVRVGRREAGGTVRFGEGGVPELAVTPVGGRAELRLYGSVGHRELRRIPELPAACAAPTPGDPKTAFDVFWQTYAENYPFFALKGVNWRQARDRYRPQVGDRPLFDVLCDMIKPLHDGHTGVMTDESHLCVCNREGTRRPSAALRRRVTTAVDEHLGVPVTSWGNGLIGFAHLNSGVGYLRLQAFDNYAEQDDYLAQREVFDHVLTTVFATPMTGLVVDVRYNLGGYDDLGLRLAARLTDRPYPAYAKQVWTGTHFTRPEAITVRPSGGRRFTGPVAMLTSDLTISAGETFTQAMLNRTPHPASIGGTTQGVFSDTMDRPLPGGGLFVLPNERFTTNGRSYDGRGIPPDVSTPVFTDEELADGRDSALDQAIDLLSR
jgi:hypothetical protein